MPDNGEPVDLPYVPPTTPSEVMANYFAAEVVRLREALTLVQKLVNLPAEQVLDDTERARRTKLSLWSTRRSIAMPDNGDSSDAVRERPIRHLPVNGPDDRQPNAPDGGQLRDAATPASGRGRSSEQGENHEAGIEAAAQVLNGYLQASGDWSRATPTMAAKAIAAYLSRVSAPPSERDTEKLAAELQALVDWFNDAPFPRAERLLHDLDEERGRDAR